MRLEKEQIRALVKTGIAAVLLLCAALLPLSGWLRPAAFLVPYVLMGYSVLVETFRAAFHGEFFSEDTLMLIASVGAFVLGEYVEAVLVLLLYSIGELCEELAEGKSRQSVTALMDLRPDCATVLRNGVAETVPSCAVAVGETVTVKPGERVPLDGVVLSGQTTLDLSALTGESLPQEAGEGTEVFSGTVNLTGLVYVRVTKPYGESTAQRILELVENAGEKKTRTERFITKFSKIYTPAVTFAAMLLAVLPPLLGLGTLREWVYKALNALVISCPCALVISVPLSFFGGIGGAGRQGILIKGASDMETLAHCDTVALDKTGTLTTGEFAVKQVLSGELSEGSLLHLAAAAEHFSTHPLSYALRKADKETLNEQELSDVKELAGNGVTAVYQGKKLAVGNGRLMERLGIPVPAEDISGTTVYVAQDGHYAGCILLSDEPKAGAKEALAELKKQGISRTVLLTGDKKAPAEILAKELGLTEVHAQLLPGDKVKAVQGLLHAGGKVAFVGDGINDAPVLTYADVGIAMGGLGSDAAIEAADVVLMDDDVCKIPLALRHARRTTHIAKENIVFALSVKAIILLLSMAGIAPLWLAVFADVGVTLLAILNALRTLKRLD